MIHDIGDHKFGEWTTWVHPAGLNAAYRHRSCKCGHVEHEGRNLFAHGKYALDLDTIPVTGGLEPSMVAAGLQALK